MYYWWYPGLHTDFGSGRRSGPAAGAHGPSSEGATSPADPDRRLERAVAAALLADAAVTGGNVDLSAQNGVVMLDGEVDSEAARSAAVARTWCVAGVTDVCNALTVRRRCPRR